MKPSRFNESQIIKAIKEHEGGRKAEDIVSDFGISQGTFYKWKQKYGGMEASDVKRLNDLERFRAWRRWRFSPQMLMR
jgi:putative transposase